MKTEQKKICLFYYNPKSILHTKVVRGFNALLLLYLAGASIEFEIAHKYSMQVGLLLVLTGFTSITIIRYALKKTVFYQWDSTERVNRDWFIFFYTFFCFLFTGLTINNIHILGCGIAKHEPLWFVIIISLVVLYCLFNLCNLPSLYYFFFEDVLTIKPVREEPKNW